MMEGTHRIQLNKFSGFVRKKETELARQIKYWKRYHESLRYLLGKIRPVFPYYGGKSYIAEDILSLIPEHNVYVEVFGGSGTILFYKKPVKLEVYNDSNRRLVNIFMVLRDKKLFMDFLHQLLFTPYSYEIFTNYLDSLDNEEEYKIPDIDRAVRDFYLFTCSVNASDFGEDGGKRIGFSRTVSSGASLSVHKYFSRLGILEYFHARIANVLIENQDAFTVMDRYDADDAFMYLDPPYHPYTVSGRKQKYGHEFPLEKHREMVDRLMNMKSKILLSGYDNPDYEKLEHNGWYKVVLRSTAKSGTSLGGSCLVIDGEVKNVGQARNECLWLNYWHDNLQNYGYEKSEEGMLYR